MGSSLFLIELGGVVLLLAILARLASRLGFSPIPLYLLAGLAFGQGGVIPLVTADEFIAAGAEIGLILLLFSLGLEYSASELRGVAPLHGARGRARPGPELHARVRRGDPARMGSGSRIVPRRCHLHLLVRRDRPDPGRPGVDGEPRDPLVLAILVFEDLAMAAFLPLGTVLLVGGETWRVAIAVGIASLVVVSVLAVAARYGEAISRAVFSRSDEALLFAILAVLLLTAGATEALNVSAAVGAFLAGIAFSGSWAGSSELRAHPPAPVFAGTFFLASASTSIPAKFPAELPATEPLAIVGATSKYATGWLAARRAGLRRRARIRSGVGLIARGEFSIVIAGIAVASGTEPDIGPIAAAYVLLLAIVGPLLARLADRSAAAPARTAGAGEPLDRKDLR